jgi:hypothetical protein
LWFLNQYNPGSGFYNMPVAVRIEGELRVEALRCAIGEVVRRHEALRTRYEAEGGMPAQRICGLECEDGREAWGWKGVMDVSGLSENERWEEARRLAIEDARRPFDLERGPVLRASVARVDEDEHVLLLNMSHISSDGWSMGVMFRELSALYESHCAGRPCEQEELEIQYADYAVWQREWLRGEELNRQLEYWRRQLSDLSSFHLPTDRPRPLTETFRGRTIVETLSPSLTDLLRVFSQQRGVTTFMTTVAALNALLYKYTNQREIALGSPIANRNRAEIENLIGFFSNTLVLRASVDERLTFIDLLEQAREMALGAYAHQDLPFELLVEELHPERSVALNPFFQMIFAFQNGSQFAPKFAGLSSELIIVEDEPARFDLELHLWDDPNQFRCVAMYKTDLFDESTVRRLVSNYRRREAAIAVRVE